MVVCISCCKGVALPVFSFILSVRVEKKKKKKLIPNKCIWGPRPAFSKCKVVVVVVYF